MTGAMIKLIELCDAAQLARLTNIFTGLTSPQFGTNQSRMLTWALGLDGDEYHDRDIHHVTNHFRIVSVGFAQQQIDNAMKQLCRLASIVPPVAYNDLRRELKELVHRHKPVIRPPNPPSAPAPPIGQPGKLFLAYGNDRQRLFFEEFLKAVSRLPAKVQDIVLYLYGLDPDGLVVPRRYGQLVGRAKIATQDQAEDRVRDAWQQMYAAGLDPEINDKHLRSQLAWMRGDQKTPVPNDGLPYLPSKSAPPESKPNPPTITKSQPAAPARSEPKPAAQAIQLPDEEDRQHFLARCDTETERLALSEVYRNLGMIPLAYRQFFIENYGLRRGRPPVSGATIARREGKSNGWLSMGTNPGWKALRRNGLPADFNGQKLYSLMCRLHGVSIRNGTPVEEPSNDRRRYQPVETVPAAIRQSLTDVAGRCAAADRGLVERLAGALHVLSPDDLEFFDFRFSLTANVPPVTTKTMAKAIGLTHGTGISTKLARIWSRLATAGFTISDPGRWFLRVMTDIRSDPPGLPDFNPKAETARLLQRCAAADRPVIEAFMLILETASRRRQRLVAMSYGLIAGHPPRTASELRTLFRMSGDYTVAAELSEIMEELHRNGLPRDINGHTIRRIMCQILELEAPKKPAAEPRVEPLAGRPSERLHELVRFRNWMAAIPALTDRALLTALTDGITGNGPNNLEEMAGIFGLERAEVQRRISLLLRQYDDWCLDARRKEE